MVFAGSQWALFLPRESKRSDIFVVGTKCPPKISGHKELPGPSFLLLALEGVPRGRTASGPRRILLCSDPHCTVASLLAKPHMSWEHL